MISLNQIIIKTNLYLLGTPLAIYAHVWYWWGEKEQKSAPKEKSIIWAKGV